LPPLPPAPAGGGTGGFGGGGFVNGGGFGNGGVAFPAVQAFSRSSSPDVKRKNAPWKRLQSYQQVVSRGRRPAATTTRSAPHPGARSGTESRTPSISRIHDNSNSPAAGRPVTIRRNEVPIDRKQQVQQKEVKQEEVNQGKHDLQLQQQDSKLQEQDFPLQRQDLQLQQQPQRQQQQHRHLRKQRHRRWRRRQRPLTGSSLGVFSGRQGLRPPRPRRRQANGLRNAPSAAEFGDNGSLKKAQSASEVRNGGGAGTAAFSVAERRRRRLLFRASRRRNAIANLLSRLGNVY